MTQADNRAIAASLAELSTSLLADAAGGKGVVAPGLARYAGTGTVAGPAVTAHCAEGSLQAVFAALEHVREGDMLCVMGPGNCAYLGDILATNLVRHGLRGVVIDGFIRDREAIAQMPLSIHAKGLFPANLRRQEPGTAMEAITLGGVVIAPGDWIVADGDGVIAIPAEDIGGVLAKARTSLLIERRIKELLSEGLKVNEAVRQAQGEILPQA